jgi:hypothetical protein
VASEDRPSDGGHADVPDRRRSTGQVTEFITMLISHRKQFIFTKTAKTAGTSVESYFEPYCMFDGEWQASHGREEYVSEAGIIGYRGSNRRNQTWFNHMSAMKIRGLIGDDIWNSYFKFTVIRNPFDKLVSSFFHKNRQLEEGTEIEAFRSWVKGGGASIDRNKYLIDGAECVDYFIRFESLHEGVKHVCDRLSIPFEPSRIPEFKKGIRRPGIALQDYYDGDTAQIAREKYAWELERFGYELPE